MISTSIAILGIAGTGLVVLFYLGYAPVRVGLALELQPYTLLLAPSAGLVVLALVGYYALAVGANLVVLGVLLVAVSTLANLAVVLRARPIVPRPDLGTAGTAAAVAALVFVLGVMPLVGYRLLTTIGHNWDPEFYLPLADLLQRYSPGALAAAPANPLVDLVTRPPVGDRPMVFSYFQGLIDLLLGRPAIDTFAVLLAVVYAAGMLSLAVLYRVGAGLGRRASGLALLLAGANGLGLWIVYNSFAMQVVALAVLPLALVALLLALSSPSLPKTLAAGVGLAAVAVAYHPVFLVFLAAGGAAGLYRLATGPERRRTVVAGAGLLVLGLAASLPAQLAAAQGFFSVYERQTPSMGITAHVPFSHLLGLTFFHFRPVDPWRDLLPGALPPLQTAGQVLFGLALGLAGLGLVRKRPGPGLYAPLAVGALVYLLVPRVVMSFPSGFPYGFLKAVSYVSFALPPLVVGGAGWLWRQARTAKHPAGAGVPWALGAGLAAVTVTLAAVLALVNLGLTARIYWGARPVYFDRSAIDLREIARAVPPGSSVLVADSERVRGPYAGLLAYFLADRELWGNLSTGYASFTRPLPAGRLAEFAVLPGEADPTLYGYQATDRLWENNRVALYRRPAGVLALTASDPPVALGHEPRQVAVPPAFGARADGGAAPGARLALDLASFQPGRVMAELGGQVEALAVRPGQHRYLLSGPVPGEGATLRLTADSPAGVFVRALALLPPGPALAGEEGQGSHALFTARTTTAGSRAATSFRLLAPPDEPLRASLDIYQLGSDDPIHFGWWVVDPPAEAEVRLDVDLATGEARALAGGGSPLAVEAGQANRRDGRYGAALWLYQGARPVGRYPVYDFTYQGGRIIDLQPRDVELAAPYLPPAVATAGTTVGGSGRLNGYTLVTDRAAPGDTVYLRLYWQAVASVATNYSVFLHLVDWRGNKVAQVDQQPAAGRAPVSRWRAGDRIADDYQLQLPHDLSPGTYRLLVGMYDPADGRRVEVHSSSLVVDGDALTLAEILVR